MQPSTLQQVVEATREARLSGAGRLDEFLRTCTLAEELAAWLDPRPGDPLPTREEIQSRISRDIAGIDERLSAQVDEILRHSAVRQLEAGWRGLRWLCDQVEDPGRVQVRVLSISWRELTRDLERSIEFDQSALFQRVYSDEFGVAGGEPYGLLLGNYEIHHRPSAEHPFDDVETLRGISQVAAAAFAPFVCGLNPSFLGLEGWSGLERHIDLTRTLQGPEYVRWHSLRASEDARFLGLVLPRLLMRLPWPDEPTHAHGFCYREPREGRLFGNAVWAFGAVAVRAFEQSGWLAEIRGVIADVDGHGLVLGPVSESYATDAPGSFDKPVLDLALTDSLEKELSDAGLIPLVHCHGTGLAAFYSTPSVKKAASYTDELITANAGLASMLHYMLCVSRFAHFLKVIGRDKVGSFVTPRECETFLNDWLHQYLNANPDVSSEMQAERPLRNARASVREVPGSPGIYHCTIELQPYYQLDQLSASVKLTTELAQSAPA